MITGTVPVKVPEKLSELELDAGGKRIDNLGLGDTPDDVMRRSEKTGSYEVYGLLAVGLAVDRPAPGVVDRLYFSTDTLVLERDTGVAWVEVVRGEAVIRLAQLAEKAHGSLTGIGVADHHARYTDIEAQAQAAALIVIHTAIAATHHAKTTDAAEITSGTFPVVRGGTGLNTIALGGILYASALDVLSRLAPTAANQVLRSTAANALQFAALLAADIPNLDASKITTGQIPLIRLVDAVCSEVEADDKILAHKGDASAHHTKYTNAEAQTTVKANVEVGDLKAPTKALAMNSQNITGVASLTAIELHGTTYWGDVYFEDVECPICHLKFKKGDKIILMVNVVEEKHISAFPVHLGCSAG